MKKTKKLIGILIILTLMSQLLPGFVNTAYAASDIVFHYSDDEEDFRDNMLPANMKVDYYPRSGSDAEWAWGNMDYARNNNSLGHHSGWYPIAGQLQSDMTSRYQYIDLRSISHLIDNGEIYYTAEVDMGNNAAILGGEDTMRLMISYRDHNKSVLGRVTEERKVPYKSWSNDVKIEMKKIPKGTRYIRYEVMGINSEGPYGMLVMFANPRLYIYDFQQPEVKKITLNAEGSSLVKDDDGNDIRIVKPGTNMDFTVEFSEPVNINTSINLGLHMKFDDPDSDYTINCVASFRHQAADRKDGGRKYIFHGKVPDVTENMQNAKSMELSVSKITRLNGNEVLSDIKDFYGNRILELDGLSLSGVPYKIDVHKPEITSIASTSGNGTFTAGEAINFKAEFSETVNVSENHKLVLNNGAAAKYQSGSGTNTINYKYTAANGDNSITGLKVTGVSGTVKDIAENTLTSTIPEQSYKINIDTHGPDITFTNADGSIYDESTTYKKEHKVYITADDDISNVDDIYYYWDTNAKVNETVDWDNTNAITNGTVSVVNPENATGSNYYLHSKATDTVGNSSVKTEGPFYFDNENPTVTINPESGENQSCYDVTITAEDEKAGIKEINYAWYRIIDEDENSEQMNSGTVENGGTITSPDMAGAYKVTVEAEDRLGNKVTKISGIYTVDKSLPKVAFSALGSDTGLKASDVDVTISDENAVKSGYYQWSESIIKPAEDDSSWTGFFTWDSSHPVSLYTDTISSGDGKNGIWYLHVKCEDATGNVAIYTTHNGFKLDNEKPGLSFSPNGNSNPAQEFTTYLQVNNESFGYTVKYEISKYSTYDDGKLTDYTLNGGDITFTLDGNTGNNETDTYYIHAKVEDDAGNISTVSSGPIYIDNTSPGGSVHLNDTYTNKSQLQLTLSADDIYPEGAKENIVMHISYDGGETFNDWIAYSQAKSITLTEEKAYDIAVQYKDSAGNESEIYSCHVLYDKTAPEIDRIQYNNGWTNEDLPVTITFSDVTDTEDIDIEIIDNETTAEVTVQNNVITFKENGVCCFKYRDLAGNENTGSITISNFDKTAPAISISPDGSGDESQSVTVLVSATDNVTAVEDIDIYYCWSQSSNVLPDNWTAESGGIVEKSEGNGKWHLWIKALDSLGNSSIFTSSEFNLDNKTPEASNITYNPSSITANNVTARIEFDEDVKIVSPESSSEYSNSFEYTFSDNGAANIVFSDRAGNENSCMPEVDWIDRSLPSAEESYIPDSWTNKPVKVKVTADDEQYTLYDFKPYIDGRRVLINAGSSDAAVAECVHNWNNDTGIYLVSGADYSQTVSDSAYGISLMDVTVNGGVVTQAEFEFNENGNMDYKIKRMDTGLTGDGQIVVDKIDNEKPEAVLTYTSENNSWNDEKDEEWTNKDVRVTIETSDNTGQPVEIINNGGSNKHVFNDSGSFDFIIKDTAGNENTVTASVYKIDKENPIASLVYTSGDKLWTSLDDEEWTNENVQVTIKASDNSGQPVEILNNDGGSKYTFTENGSFVFKIRDAAENESEIAAKVSRMDKEAPNPVITYNTQEWTNGNVTVSLSFDNELNAVTILNNDGSNEYAFTENGAFTFEFEDAAGNKDEITIAVYNIDKAVPQVDELWYSNTEPTNGKVIVKVYTDENVDFLTDNGADNYTFEENGIHEFKFVDRAGNANSTTAQVTNIDKIPPDVWIEYSTTDPTNDDVVATLKADEEINVINNLNKNQYVFTENGEFIFIYEDLAGNSGEVTAKVENIDTTLPTITLEYSETEPTRNDVTVTIISDKDITPVNYTGDAVTFTKNETKWLKALDPFGEEFYFEAQVGNIDREAPGIEFSTGENLVVEKGSGFNPLTDFSITDNLDEEISSKLTVTNDVDVNTEGEYEINYSAVDSAGNSVSVTRKVIVVNPDSFTAFINTDEAETDEIVTQGQGISLDLFGLKGDYLVKWLEGKKSKGDFKECEEYCEDGYIEIVESGYYTLLIQDQERNTKLLHVYVIYSE